MAAQDERIGFRRRINIVPNGQSVTAAVEDDFHCMAVTLVHDCDTVTAVEADMERAPWTTCPQAVVELATTFTGVALTAVAKRGLKSANCTHLYDLAILAAAHVQDAFPTVYDVFVSDAVEGRKHCEIRKGNGVILDWAIEHDRVSHPAVVAGTHLLAMRDWIATLEPTMREAARILQWAALIAHGRDIPIAAQSDATRMPPNCFTFQPDRARLARRIGEIVDFSQTDRDPLDHFNGRDFVR